MAYKCKFFIKFLFDTRFGNIFKQAGLSRATLEIYYEIYSGIKLGIYSENYFDIYTGINSGIYRRGDGTLPDSTKESGTSS